MVASGAVKTVTIGTARLARVFALGCALAGLSCTIERSRQAGENCLQDRECAQGLRCELATTGGYQCVTPVRVDANVPPVVDSGTPVTDAAQDTGAADTSARDVMNAPEDVPMDRGEGPVDVPRDVPRDGVSVADASIDGDALESDALTVDADDAT